MNGLVELSHNITFWCAFAGWVLAQGIKASRHYLKTRRVDFSYFVRT
ncbi:MAG: hypothetical protein GWO24_04850, partial [Akkermansiaceae bacterium]|nr:hypothetical protein [Akkermansiaceae bacterium]